MTNYTLKITVVGVASSGMQFTSPENVSIATEIYSQPYDNFIPYIAPQQNDLQTSSLKLIETVSTELEAESW